MALRLYNTLTRQKELFEPLEPGKVGIYLCGPTVYKESHIGHAVGPVLFDALKRYLTYKGYQVTLIVNITDVDDKIIQEAKEQDAPAERIASQVTEWYLAAMEKLGVTTVDCYPRVSEHIAEVINLIQRLGERDAAYAVNGDVYFDISKCAEYGKLSNRSPEEQLEGTRELAGTGKRQPGDFALWKAVGAEEAVGWESPWGRGRPGWHIECSVMSMKYLGESFDIHGGGIDLVFPHHENELAQSETATGKPLAKYWLHNGLTRVRTKAAGGEWQEEKMSKSLGNVRSIRELLAAYPAACIRFFILSTHYRRPIDFSDEAIQGVQKGMMALVRLFERVVRLSGQDVYRTACLVSRLWELGQVEPRRPFRDAVLQAQLKYLEALDDDFNTAQALAVLFDLAGQINRFIDQERLEVQGQPDGKALALEAARMLSSLGQILGLLEGPVEAASGEDRLAGGLMELLIGLRERARREKDFALADGIRDGLKKLGVVLEDRPAGTIWRQE